MATSSVERLLLLPLGIVLLIIGRLFYNHFFHPLRSYPGPWYVNISIIWYLYHIAKGDHYYAVHQLHLKYGPVVRVAPNELSFVQAQAWKEIYGHRATGKPEFMKDPSTTFADDPAHPHILVAPGERHAKLRKLLSHAFSDKALREQESVINNYVMSLLKELRTRCSERVDMVQWYNFTTFDIIGHLAFAESFDCLSTSDYHPWVNMLFSTIRVFAWTRALGRLAPGFIPLLLRLIPKRVLREYKANLEMTAEKLSRRKEKKLDYTDFAEHLIKAEEDGILDTKDLLSNLPLLVVAGSETTATALSGTTYYLLANPRVYKRVVEEVRSQFQDHSEITLPRVSELKYLPAVFDESLRMYPPANNSHPRLVPPGGSMVCGHFIPGRSLVGIPHYGCFRSPYNFFKPEEFIPERYLAEDDQFLNDRREALQPFHLGPRNCIGRNLAHIEMRLIITHVLLEFDLELEPESMGWDKQEVYAGPLKPPLMVRLRPVQGL
ncbi:putative cytochrome P450 monooxygenase [Xylariaceae sp. FL1651]|nr:putative cytochrome P450 monooxygenase [Xylariaceae sp. FL1651]